MQDGFYKSHAITADIAGFLLAAFADPSNGDRVALMTGPGQPVAGVTDSVGGTAAHGLVDLQLTQVADLRFGGVVAAGDPITADAFGRGVKAVKPAAGSVVWCIGTARGPGLADDIGKVLISPFAIYG
ncbi:hypothetical protein [Methylobacterium iners]|uniref:DUF2190 domain-containing protein n=1 Tax=Methylobacterium iners TaxID=418707 RepID=A0ABQ4RRG5_9HYPH|nr:hypothetical protein [Methylobacterium iners]GJD93365.1 hypothetical protein OCOJLMKI_0559 [Methylobacterium iners]